MFSHVMRAAFAMTALMALPACSIFHKDKPMEAPTACDNSIAPGVEVTGMPSWLQFQRQFVDGESTREILRSEEGLRSTLQTLAKENGKSSETEDISILRTKIEAIEGSDLSSGMAGIAVNSFLHAARASLDEQGRFAFPIVFITKGKVEAYFYDPGPKEDCLRVLMVTKALRPSGETRVLAYRWTIFGDFQATPKKPDTDPDYDSTDVFPGSNTVEINEDTAEGFNYKLWARGSSIRVASIERSVLNGPFTPLPSNDPLYQTTPASCIDMMFDDYPPQTLPPDAAPPFYCLGRCDHPRVINTK